MIGIKISPTETSRDHVLARVFSASCELHVFASNLDWTNGLSVFFVIAQSDNFDFGLKELRHNILSHFFEGLNFGSSVGRPKNNGLVKEEKH